MLFCEKDFLLTRLKTIMNLSKTVQKEFLLFIFRRRRRKMKKIFAVAVALIMVLTLSFGLVGCGESEEESETLKVGFLYLGTAQDGGFTQAQDEGRAAMEKHFDGAVETMTVEEVDEDKDAVITAGKNLLDQGCQVIIAGSFGFMDGMEELANEYPDQYFLHFSGNKSNDTNFDNFFGAMEEPRYLAGIVAGMTTETNKVGYVAAFPYTEVNIGINAFALGVQSVNPDAEVKVVYINTWYDPTKEKEAAEALLDQGCDVLEQHCDTVGPTEAARDAEAHSIGYNLDIGKDYPETFMTAPIWHYDAYYIQVVQDIMDGKFKPSQYYGNMADGFVDLAPLADFVSDDIKAKVEEVKAEIVAGDFAPLSGEIQFTNGEYWCKEGQTLTREEIWLDELPLVKGVTSSEYE